MIGCRRHAFRYAACVLAISTLLSFDLASAVSLRGSSGPKPGGIYVTNRFIKIYQVGLAVSKNGKKLDALRIIFVSKKCGSTFTKLGYDIGIRRASFSWYRHEEYETVKVTGKFVSSKLVTGTFRSRDRAEGRLCDSGVVRWTARLQPRK